MSNEPIDLRDPIFKGCTRPPMKWGIPLVPLVVVFCSCFLGGMWGMFLFRSVWVFFGAITIFAVLFVTMRAITKKDDQRFRQIWLWIVLRVPNRNRRFWRAASYSPIRYKRR